MKKILLSDGHWFDGASAKRFGAEYYIDNSGAEICATIGLPFLHEALYLTKNGHLVLVRTCDHYAPDAEGAYEIDMMEAAKWLLQNGYQDQIAPLEIVYEERQLEL